MTYRFRVGTRPLKSYLIQKLGDAYVQVHKLDAQATHACFLINTTIFEYDMEGYHRRDGAGRDPEFNWDHLGSKINGTTHVSPDDLEKAICNSGLWTGDQYNILNHNCHYFVRECLRIVGAGFFFQNYDQSVNKVFE